MITEAIEFGKKMTFLLLFQTKRCYVYHLPDFSFLCIGKLIKLASNKKQRKLASLLNFTFCDSKFLSMISFSQRCGKFLINCYWFVFSGFEGGGE